MKILIIEDDPAMMEMWVRYLTPTGSEVIQAKDYETAEREMRKIPPPDMVFLDLVLPDSRDPEDTLRCGVEMIRGMNPESVIIVITGMNSAKIAQLAMSVGADGFNFKHEVVGQRKLLRAVQGVLETRKASPRGCVEECLLLVEKLNSLLSADAA